MLLDRALATVEGRVITLVGRANSGPVRARGHRRSPTSWPSTLERLIDRTLMLAEVERYVPPEPDAAAIRQRGDRMRARLPSEDAFSSALRVAGID